MVKAFDPKDLAARLKVRGLHIAEEGISILFSETMDWLNDSFILTEGKYDDFICPAIPSIKSIGLSQIDKIDGEVG